MKPQNLARLVLLSFLSLLVGSNRASARILNVPEDYQTIQAGIDAARSRDTILVAPGIYDENVVFRANGTVLGSLILTTGIASYIDSTIIDAGRRDCGISVEVDSGLVRGFTVRNGIQQLGGGIDVRNGSGTRYLEDMIITGDSAIYGGAGIYLSDGREVILRRVRIFDNGAAYGGGFDIGEFFNGTARIEDCEIIGNRASWKGGGFAVHVGAPPNLYFDRVLIAGNSAPSCAVAYFKYANLHLKNTTITANTSTADSTGGIGGFQNSDVTIENCIIYENSQPQISCAEVDEDGFRCEISFSNIQGGEEGIERHRNGLRWGQGNLDTDPLFIDPANGDYHLTANSPCIDAGNPESPPDSDGTRADMGVYSIVQRSAVIGGRVVDLASGDGISGAAVEVLYEGELFFRDLTDADGAWGQWTPLWADSLQITIRVSNFRYATWTSDTVVHNEEHLSAEARMGFGIVVVPDDPPQLTLQEGDSTQFTVLMQNVGNTPVNWSANWIGTGVLSGRPGEIYDSVAVGNLLNDDRIEGVAFDGENYYLAGANGEDSSLIYVLDSDFRFVSSFPQPCHTRYGMKDLEWDGQMLWGSGDSVIYGFSREGDLIVRFRGPFNPNNYIAYDPVHETYWVSATTTDITELDLQGNVLDTLNRKSLRMYGLAWDEADPDGYKLQLLTSNTPGRYCIFKMNTETGDTLRCYDYFDSVRTNISGLSVIQGSDGQATALITRGLNFGGGEDLLDFIRLRSNREWVVLSPTQGRIIEDQSATLDVTVKTFGTGGWAFASGQYEGVITITDDGRSQETVVPFVINVSPNSVNGGRDDLLLPNRLTLSAFPNPFNGMVRLSFSTGPINREATLKVYGVDGRLVEELWSGRNARHSESYSVTWNADGLPAGVYLVRLESGVESRTIKTVLIK